MPELQHSRSGESESSRNDPNASERLKDLVATVLDDMKANDVVVLDVRHLTSITDYMFIASGRSDRHVRAIADTLVERCREAGCKPLGVEGTDAGEWALIDLADVIVHVMVPATREFYEIEKLWDISAAKATAPAPDSDVSQDA